jgi:NitT/TauT family transport system substrate-binding protein
MSGQLDVGYATSPFALQFVDEGKIRIIARADEILAKKGMAEFYKKEMLDPYRVSGLDAVMSDAISLKLLQAPLTKEQLDELFQVPQRGK